MSMKRRATTVCGYLSAIGILTVSPYASADPNSEDWSRAACESARQESDTEEVTVTGSENGLLRGVPRVTSGSGPKKQLVLVFSSLTPGARAQLARGLQAVGERTDTALFVLWTQPEEDRRVLWQALHEAQRVNDSPLVHELLDLLVHNGDTAWLIGELSRTKSPALESLPRYERLLPSLGLSPEVKSPVFFLNGAELPSDGTLAEALDQAPPDGHRRALGNVVARKVVLLDPSDERSTPSGVELPQVEFWGDLSEGAAFPKALVPLLSESGVQLSWRFVPHFPDSIRDLDLMAAEIGRTRGGEVLWQFVREAATIQGPDRVGRREDLAVKYGATPVKKMSRRSLNELRSLVEGDFEHARQQGLCGPYEYVVGEYHVSGQADAAQLGNAITQLGRRIERSEGLRRSSLTPDQRRRLREPPPRTTNLGGISGSILSHVDTAAGQDNVTSTFGRLVAQMDGLDMKRAVLGSVGWAVGGGNGLDLSAHALFDMGLAYPEKGPARIFARVGAGARLETTGLLSGRTEFTHLHLALPRGSVGFQYWGDDWAVDIAPSASGLLAHTYWSGITSDELGYAYGGRITLLASDFQLFANAFRAREFLRSEAQACTQLFGKDLGVCVQGGHILGTDGFSERVRYSLGGSIGLLKFDL